jgi:NADPH:quinone reductase
MEAASINRGDIMGLARRHNADVPRLAGVDGCGIVEDPGHSKFAKGQRVLFRAHGCYAEFAAVNPMLAAPVPASLSPEQAAAIPGAFITAWEGLIQYGRARAGDWVLLCGASSGVGVAALQTARHLGTRVIAVSGSPEKRETLRQLGADAVVVARGRGFAAEVMRITENHGADVCLNMVGGTAFPDSVQAAANFGRVVMVGYVDRQLRAECDLEALHSRRLEISGISNTALTAAQRGLAMDGFMRDVFPAIASGAIKPVIDRVFPFDDLPAAKAYVETNRLIGKVVIRIA